MYAPYFGLSQEPFSIAPDPRYLYMSERHREALAHLLYGLGGGGGFVLLTGEIGTGKTTVCRCFLEQVPATCNVAYIFNPKLTATELLQSVCDEFRIALPPKDGLRTVKDYLDPLNAFLLAAHAQGRNSVLIIDEAQNLSADVLEQLRLLTNLETSERKLLQVVLIGQPELRELLARPELEQLAQRVVARYHLDALTRQETEQYVRHRFAVAGLARALPFDRAALERVHKLTGGVPRRINLLCDRALLGAYGRSEAMVTGAIVDQAAREVFDTRGKPARAWPRQAALVGLGIVVGAGLVAALRGLPERAAVAPEAGAAASAPAAMPASAPASLAKADAAPASTAVSAPPTLFRSEQEAWRALAQAWKADAGAADACRQLAGAELQCFMRNMPLALIRQLDRPGIVVLDRATGTPSYALLTAVGDKSATLVAGGSEQTVTLDALAARWSGDWATLWRAPPGYTRGDTAATLAWVRKQLAVDDGAAEAALAAKVRKFQVAHGLPADGLLGPLTYMQLNRAAGVDEPRLRPIP